MTTPRALLKRHMAIGALFAILTAAGCGTEVEPDTASSPDAATTASPAPSSNPDAAATSALPSPTAAASEASNADSADYESCGDGECEVSFTGSVEFPLGGTDGQWTVESAIEDDGVRVNLVDADGMGAGGGLLYEPGCFLALKADGGGSLACAEAAPEPETGGYVVQLLELTGDTAVIHAALG